MKLGVPTLARYDLLQRLIDTVEMGSEKPSGFIIVDNGGEARSRLRLPANTELIEPGRNIGVAASWNRILDVAGDEPVVISNDDVLFGPQGFRVLSEAARQHPLVTADGWALFAQSPDCTRKVGFYDEGFYPAYFEDNDYAYRMDLCGVPRHVVAVQAKHYRSATLEARPGLNVERSREYYQLKWGGPPGRETHREPFGGKPPEGWAIRGSKWQMPRKRSIIDYIYGR